MPPSLHDILLLPGLKPAETVTGHFQVFLYSAIQLRKKEMYTSRCWCKQKTYLERRTVKKKEFRGDFEQKVLLTKG